MNLLCPNCQKMLTVPEQYAGQLMKCPLCAGTFTVPALPSMSLSEPAPQPPPPPAPPSFPEQNTYGVKHEPVSTPLPPAPLPSVPLTPAPLLSTPAPSKPEPPPSLPRPSAPAGSARTEGITFSPRVLQWVPPVCVVLIFILQFFTWLQIAPGGVWAFRQGAWSAAFASGETNGNLKENTFYGVFTGKTTNEKTPLFDETAVSASILTVFYVLLFLPTMIITVGVIVLAFMKVPPLPPFVQQLLPYRWGIVTVLNLLVFFFLLLQLILGFDLESAWAKKVNDGVSVLKSGETREILENEAKRGILFGYADRTIWLRLVVVLHLLTILAAGMVYWLGRRGEHRPLPRIELIH